MKRKIRTHLLPKEKPEPDLITEEKSPNPHERPTGQYVNLVCAKIDSLREEMGKDAHLEIPVAQVIDSLRTILYGSDWVKEKPTLSTCSANPARAANPAQCDVCGGTGTRDLLQTSANPAPEATAIGGQVLRCSECEWVAPSHQLQCSHHSNNQTPTRCTICGGDNIHSVSCVNHPRWSQATELGQRCSECSLLAPEHASDCPNSPRVQCVLCGQDSENHHPNCSLAPPCPNYSTRHSGVAACPAAPPLAVCECGYRHPEGTSCPVCAVSPPPPEPIPALTSCQICNFEHPSGFPCPICSANIP